MLVYLNGLIVDNFLVIKLGPMHGVSLIVPSVYSFIVLCRPSQMLSVVYSEPFYSKLCYHSAVLKLMRLTVISKADFGWILASGTLVWS